MPAADNILFLGESIGFWVQTGAVILSTIAAILVIGHNGKMARRRATIDLIIEMEKDEEYKEKYKTVSQLIKKDQSLVNFAEKLDVDCQELDDIRFVINRLEFIAQGIRCKAFEEGIYKDLHYNNYLKLWGAVEPLVAEIRRRNGNTRTYFQEMEWLAHRWHKKEIKKLK